MSKPMMKCGHAANASVGEKPVCAICIGIVPGAEEVDDSPPNLKGRMAHCVYCGSMRPSQMDLPFFEYGYMKQGVHDETKDSYYDGCRGWD